MRTVFRTRGSRVAAEWRSVACTALLAWPGLASSQAPVDPDVGSSWLTLALMPLAMAVVISVLCFGAAIVWATRRPAGSVNHKALLAGTAAVSIGLTFAVFVVARSPTTWLLLQAVGNIAAFIVLSGWYGRRDGQVSQASPVERVAEPSERPAQPAQRAQVPPVPPAARSPQPPATPAPAAPGVEPGTVFISYRRIDSSDVTGRIYDRLVASHGRAHVFKDVDSIPLGTDFRRHVADLISRSDCVLAVIGRQWLDTTDAAGRRRLDDPTDLVRIEIEAALSRGVPVIPLLVQGALMPDPQAMPEVLRPLAFRNGMSVRADPDFHRDLDRLDEQLRLLASTGAR
jgi:TIR domain